MLVILNAFILNYIEHFLFMDKVLKTTKSMVELPNIIEHELNFLYDREISDTLSKILLSKSPFSEELDYQNYFSFLLR